MNILIIEDEIYLAQKVSARLQDEGYHAFHFASVSDVDLSIKYDAVLLSTNISENYEDIIRKYSSSIIILLVTYVSEATVTNPINAGASDYILKPFMIDELVRKIKHYEEFNNIKKENARINNYFDFIFNPIVEIKDIPKELPLLIETNEQKIADKIVYEIANRLGFHVAYISLKESINIKPENYKNMLLYLYDFHTLKKTSKKLVLNNCKDFNIVISSIEQEELECSKITIMAENKISIADSILTVNDYVKYITLNFQSKYPDTELSRRLGISRKSLWEKRKKFGIEKKSLNKKDIK